MQKVSTGKMTVAVAGLIVLIGVALYFKGKPSKAPDVTSKPSDATPQTENSAPASARSFFSPRRATPEPEGPTDGETGLPPVPREKVEEYLARHHRNAASLLAALHATGDTNYLREAATNFPGDPRLQYTVLMRDVFPEERRKWLDAFKASAPGNSLANYLSAADYFQSGQRDAALAELEDATHKPQFQNYGTESRLDAEELCLASGQPQMLSSMIAVSGIAVDFLPELSTLKQVATGAGEAIKQYTAAGDTQATLALTGMGLKLADQLRSGDSGKYIIRELVGNATEAIILGQLDPNTSYDLLGGKTPAQRMEELKQRKLEIRNLSAGFNETFFQTTEVEQVNYLQRAKIYGEVEARRWLQQQHGAAGGKQAE